MIGMKKFETGATRTDDSLRDDPEGYLSPLVIERYCQYMTKHRVQADGSVRDSDNWQKGMPESRGWKGLYRHFLHGWLRWRGFEPHDKLSAENTEEDLCAMLFNINVILHQRLVEKRTLMIGNTTDACSLCDPCQAVGGK
jgi:hypothetical protein